MAHNFCRYLTNGLRVQSWHGRLVAAPCCYLTPIPIDSINYDNEILKYQSQKSCQGCMYYISNDTSDKSYPPNRALRIIPDTTHTHPTYAELAIDNKCNAACMSCTDSFSSLWESQNKKFNIKTEDDYPDPQDDNQVVEDLFNKFNFTYLTELNFLGGEPLISKANFLVIERLIELGIAKNIAVRFTTNGSTRLTDYQSELLSHFRRVDFTYSIDGIEERFHYLRYPLKWEKLLSVIEFTKNINTIHNLGIIVNVTVSALNAFYLDEIESWTNEFVKDNRLFKDLHFAPCTAIMSLEALPKEAKIYLQQKHASNTRLSNMFATQRTNPHAINTFLNHLSLWDHNRGLDWKKTFPAAVPFFKDYLITK